MCRLERSDWSDSSTTICMRKERDCMRRLAASGRGRRGGWHQLMRGEAGSTARRTQIELRFSLTGRGVVSQMGRCGPSLGCVSLHRSESKMSHTQLRVIAVGLSVLKLVAGQTTSGPTSAPTSAFFTLSPTIPDGDCGTAASDTQCMVSHMILQHTRWSFELVLDPHAPLPPVVVSRCAMNCLLRARL